MNSQLRWADACRLIGRILSLFLVVITIAYLLFVGLQLLSGEGGFLALSVYMLVLLATLVGMIVAWWREALGAVILLAALMGAFILSGVLEGWRSVLGSALLNGPLQLLTALIVPGYSPDRGVLASIVPVLAWILSFAPAGLFLASWWLRRKPKPEPTRAFAR